MVLAAVEAAVDEEYNLRGLSATTAHGIPLLIVSGPICGELGINTKAGCMGPGNRANATIGRALNLVCTAVGGRWSGTTSMSTFSDAGRFTWCIGEDDTALPPEWKPLRVEKGFKAEQSTISIMGVHYRCGFGIPYFAPTYEVALETIVVTMEDSGFGWGGENMLVLSPDVAQTIVGGAPTKETLRQQLFDKTAVRWHDIKDHPKTKELFPENVAKTLKDESIVTKRCITPDDINIVVTGGAGSHSIFLTPWIKTRTITTLVDKWR